MEDNGEGLSIDEKAALAFAQAQAENKAKDILSIVENNAENKAKIISSWNSTLKAGRGTTLKALWAEFDSDFSPRHGRQILVNKTKSSEDQDKIISIGARNIILKKYGFLQEVSDQEYQTDVVDISNWPGINSPTIDTSIVYNRSTIDNNICLVRIIQGKNGEKANLTEHLVFLPSDQTVGNYFREGFTSGHFPEPKSS